MRLFVRETPPFTALGPDMEAATSTGDGEGNEASLNYPLPACKALKRGGPDVGTGNGEAYRCQCLHLGRRFSEIYTRHIIQRLYSVLCRVLHLSINKEYMSFPRLRPHTGFSSAT